MRKINHLVTIALIFTLMSAALAQVQSAHKPANGPQAQSASSPVTGSGTLGQIPKWTGAPGASVLGDSGITEDKFGNIGIGTTAPTAKLTIIGMIQTTLGGYKFPDGTVQTTAGIAPDQVVRSLNGLKGDLSLNAGANITITPGASALTITATGLLTSAAHDTTLIGNGTSAQPLGIALPLTLTGHDISALFKVKNTSIGSAASFTGSDNDNLTGGTGVIAEGGKTSEMSGVGGLALNAFGGNSLVKGDGGEAVHAIGGTASGTGSRGGTGIVGIGGSGLNGAAQGLGGFFAGDVEIGNGISHSGLKVQDPSTFDRNVFIGGILTVLSGLDVIGSKHFKIDHPLDPENKYLYHASIESSEVLNLYSGNITTDENGDATVQLPDWFEAINKDFRYQLTVIGSFAQAIVANEISGNRFSIKTNAARVKVSWQVTGVRSDPVMIKHPFKLEEDKVEAERGFYLSPDAYNQPEEKGMEWAHNPDWMQRMKARVKEARQQ